MRRIAQSRVSRAAALLLLSVLSARQLPGAKQDAAAPPTAAPAAAAAAGAPHRIEIVGASVSAGFVDGPLTGGSPDNRSVSLQRVVAAWLADEPVQVRSGADLMLFRDPEGRAPRQIERALGRSPDLVLAVDFLFWFGYGYVESSDDGELSARRARLQIGLDLLDRLPCPMVVGDLPDVTGADRRMISPPQIPGVAIQEGLNDDIAAWATARPRVQLFPLRELVATMKQRGVELPVAGAPLPTAPGGLMQGDRLHATRLGMAYLGYRLQAHMRQALPPGSDWLEATPFARFVDAADAAGDLELLRASSAGREPAGR